MEQVLAALRDLERKLRSAFGAVDPHEILEDVQAIIVHAEETDA